MALDINYTPKDSFFGKPFIDLDEQRQYPRPHRYVHGGFEGTTTLFAFYFPPAEFYRGRFTQFLDGGAGGNERAIMIHQDNPKPSQWDYLYDMAFDDLNAYLMESNQGHGLFNTAAEPSPGVYSWRASAETARFSRHLAKQIYGKAPEHGYIGGIGGGAGRAIACMENASDIFDGCTPQIVGSSASPFSAMQRAILMLGPDRLKEVIDAVEPGGSGDPYATLNGIQREALADLYRCGYPRGAESQLKQTRTIGFMYLALEKQDPAYFEDFWTKPGYAGFDRAELLKPYIIEMKAKVKEVVPISRSMEPATLEWYSVLPKDMPFAVELDAPGERGRYYGCEMTVLSGAAKGRNLFLYGAFNGLSGSPERTPEMMKGVQPGDEVQLDNRRFIAFLHYFLHSIQAPPALAALTHEPIARAGRPFAPDDIPMYPQRAAASGGSGIKGAFEGKMIYILSTHDIYAWPVTGDYADIYGGRYGDKIDERFRFYWAEHAVIGAPQVSVAYNVGEGDLRVWDTRLIDYQHSMGRYAWRYLKEWVEDGKAPPASTNYKWSDANALQLPKDGRARAGIQPVVKATVNGGKRADVKVGQTVQFEGVIETPPGAGAIVSSEWDFEHTGEFKLKNSEADGKATTLKVKASHAFAKPGVYFVAFRGGVQHFPGKIGSGMPTHNLDRVRVVVTG